VGCALLNLIPAATSLAASASPTVSVTLDWAASTGTNIAGYKIYYGTTSGSYTQVVTIGPVTQVTISGLTPQTTYYFTATAFDSDGLESLGSNEASFTVPVPQPELRLVRVGSKSTLQWPTNFPGYTLQWSSSPTGVWTDLTSSPAISGGSFTHKNTTGTAQRYYRLKK
jgi:hypothetical protein